MTQTCGKHERLTVAISVCLCVCILVCVSIQDTVCSQNAYLTSVAVLMVGMPQAFNIIAVSTIIFWNDQLVAGLTFWSILPLWTFKRKEKIRQGKITLFIQHLSNTEGIQVALDKMKPYIATTFKSTIKRKNQLKCLLCGALCRLCFSFLLAIIFNSHTCSSPQGNKPLQLPLEQMLALQFAVYMLHR